MSWHSCRRDWGKQSWWWRTLFLTHTTVQIGGCGLVVSNRQTPPTPVPVRRAPETGIFSFLSVPDWRGWQQIRRRVSCSSWQRSLGWCRRASWWRTWPQRRRRRATGKVYKPWGYNTPTWTQHGPVAPPHLTCTSTNKHPDGSEQLSKLCRLSWGASAILGTYPVLLSPQSAARGGGWAETHGWTRPGRRLTGHHGRSRPWGSREFYSSMWWGRGAREWFRGEPAQTRGGRARNWSGRPWGGSGRSLEGAGVVTADDIRDGAGEDGGPHQADREGNFLQHRPTEEQEEES